MLNVIHHIPKGLMNIKSTDLHTIFSGSTLIHLKGKKNPPLLISCLMHGNEFTGLLALQALMKKYGESHWPRSVYLFFGNIDAAKANRRHLDGQPDYNRSWKKGDLPENHMTQEVVRVTTEAGLFATIDIHNNTGRNPHYSIISNDDVRHKNLAALFGELCMYFDEVIDSNTQAFMKHCPSVTLEAGQPGNPDGTKHVLDFLEKVLTLDEVSKEPAQTQLKLIKMIGTVKLKKETTVGVGNEEGDIHFEPDFDLMNFKEMPAGTFWGFYRGEHRLEYKDRNGVDRSDEVFDYRDGKIITKIPTIPSMLKLDKNVLKSNCVGYLMRWL
jgi:succinylglutamate desuccinylase